MITHMSHMFVYTANQGEALEFYTKKLGFEVHTDVLMQEPNAQVFRWLTVRPKGQKNLEIALIPPDMGDMLDEESSKALHVLLKKGVLVGGALYTNDCPGMCEKLKALGVEFISDPDVKPYGVIEAIFKDNSGNCFCLVQDVVLRSPSDPRETPKITHVSHVIVYAKNPDEALTFYTQKLGCEHHTDVMIKDPKVKDFRWLTVTPKEQKNLEIVLMTPETGDLLDEESMSALHTVLKKGVLGAGIFATKDCYSTSQKLKKQGVEFLAEPHEHHNFIESVFKDNSGNWFCLVQQTP